MYRVSDKELRADKTGEIAAKMAAAVCALPSNEDRDALSSELRAFEDSHGFTTAHMRCRLKDGLLEETEAIARWHIVAKLYDRYVAAMAELQRQQSPSTEVNAGIPRDALPPLTEAELRVNLKLLHSFEDDWDDDGAPKPDNAALDRAAAMLEACVRCSILPYEIVADPVGGVVFSWFAEKRWKIGRA